MRCVHPLYDLVRFQVCHDLPVFQYPQYNSTELVFLCGAPQVSKLLDNWYFKSSLISDKIVYKGIEIIYLNSSYTRIFNSVNIFITTGRVEV